LKRHARKEDAFDQEEGHVRGVEAERHDQAARRPHQQRPGQEDIAEPPTDELREEGLVYSTDSKPGIRRVRRGRGFTYLDRDGNRITDEATLERIRALAVPPAWTDVWICDRPRGHLQATGRDARGRKQSRYHERWTEMRDADKFSRTIGFMRVLPKIRRRVAADLRRPGLDHDKVIATVVRLMQTTLIRVGNEEYAKENRSFGLTTLRQRHVHSDGNAIRLRFKGKSGKQVDAMVTDRRIVRIIRRLQELPGQELFEWLDADGVLHDVSSDDVNNYLRETTGEDYTAKDFRTWAGTVLAAAALRGLEGFESESEAKRNVVAAIDRVARRLGNTRAVARRSYVHPAVVESYMDGSLDRALESGRGSAAVLTLLKRRLARERANRRR
jgi:DNA topoisomerase-1